MNEIIGIILIGISLSMDAFSLSLIYGMNIYSKRKKVYIALLVGIYHFVMPILGHLLGDVIVHFFKIGLNITIFVSFLCIAIDMLTSSIKEKEEKFIGGLFGFIIFGFTVSIDSFITGIGIEAIGYNIILVSSIFLMVSSMFTYLGLTLGDRITRKFGKYATTLGSIILIILAFYYLFYL